MKHGFVKVAVATPKLFLADAPANARELVRLTQEASRQGVQILLFPALSLTGATVGDLALSECLIEGARRALESYLSDTRDTTLLSIVGLPLQIGRHLCNVAAVCQAGRVLALVPQMRPQATDTRRFTSPSVPTTLSLFGTCVPVTDRPLLTCSTLPSLSLAVSLDRDPLTEATLLALPCATPELVGSRSARRTHALAASETHGLAIALAEPGDGESTTDAVYGGHALLVENGTLLAERAPLSNDAELTVSEIDTLALLRAKRALGRPASAAPAVEISFALPTTDIALTRPVAQNPFLPEDPEELRERCRTILSIQSTGLARRMERARAKRLVVGISGGLDSTLALLVMARATDLLGLDRRDILAVTMPGFGTSGRTKNNAVVLCEELGVELRCIPIGDAVLQHFNDIDHDPTVRDVTYENAQARERTQILMDLANASGGLVVGTGDLSELALGFATYNGDHMSMYGVNASLPKTVIRHVVAYEAAIARERGASALANALEDILATPVSPELLPAEEDGSIAQKTEELVGPYELHDFFLYHTVRLGESPSKILRLAKHALGHLYDDATLVSWLDIFSRRFFAQQFKRSCLPDGPKVGTLSLSPRGDWSMPSDVSAALWKTELEELKAQIK